MFQNRNLTVGPVAACATQSARTLTFVMLPNRGLTAVPTILMAIGLTIGLTIGCKNDRPAASNVQSTNRTVTVASSIYPLHFFAEQIGGDLIQAIYPIADDQFLGDAARWSPSTKSVKAMQNADAVILNGAGYESWLPLTTLPQSKIVSTADAFSSAWIHSADQLAHQHGPQGPRDQQANVAPGMWLDPDLAIAQSEQVLSVLTNHLEEKRTVLVKRHNALRARLNELSGSLKQLAPVARNRMIIAAEPGFAYLRKTLGLPSEGGVSKLDADSLDSEIERLKQAAGKFIAADIQTGSDFKPVILFSKLPEPETARRLNNAGFEILVLDLLSNPPNASSQPDFISMMGQNVQRLKQVLAVQ